MTRIALVRIVSKTDNKQLDKCATEATSSRSAVQVERYSTSSLETALSLNVAESRHESDDEV